MARKKAKLKTPIDVRETITIYADFGAAYAWIKPANNKTPLVGKNIADALKKENGVSHYKNIGIPEKIDKEFSTWISTFEENALTPTFDWDKFHKEGIKLSTNLKKEINKLGNKYDVAYCPPSEDPIRLGEPSIPIKISSHVTDK